MKFFNPLLLTFFVVSFSLQSQQIDLNDSFLKSLPANLQKDFQSESNAVDKEGENIPNPDTRIQSLTAALKDAELLLAKVQKELDKSDPQFELNRIGDDFFQTFQSTFLPINEPNFNSNYILDVGDIIGIQLIGQINKNYKLKINRNGAINIPSIGEFYLSGLSLADSSIMLKKLLSEAFIGTEAFISLSELRDISAMIIGHVNKPGLYTLAGGSSPLSLLYAAGGIDQNGSFRSVLHKRDNLVIQNIDLYEVLIHGNLKFEHQLRSGDVLIVSPKLSEVRVSGSFSKQGIFELLPDESLYDLINFASPKSFTTNQSFKIERLESSEIKLLEVSKDKAGGFELKNGDSIVLMGVEPKFNKAKTVTLTGEVRAPGVYHVDDNMHLSELIKMAGGFSTNAYPDAGILIRDTAKKLENEAKEKTYYELVRYLVSSPRFSEILAAPNSESVITFLSLMKSYEPSGRIIAEFNNNKVKSNKRLDRLIADGDRIHVPEFSDDVYVFGEVLNPGATKYNELASPNDYINAAGGTTRVADQSRSILIMPNGEVENINLKRFSFMNINNSPLIMPGSTIYVPQEVGKVDGINLASDLAPIISSFALSVASLNALNN